MMNLTYIVASKMMNSSKKHDLMIFEGAFLMRPFNNYDKLNIKKLLIIIKILQQAYRTENLKHKNRLQLNDLGVRVNENTNPNKNFISTLHIIIAEKNIDIPIESTFKLKNAALDIKSTKKDVYLTSSKLLPMYGIYDSFSPSNGKLFLEGFIRNKLDFSIVKDIHGNIIDLDTESFIIYIPFKCTTLIQYKVPPIFTKGKTLDYIPIYISSDCVSINKDYHENLYKYPNKENSQCKKYINCNTPPINCEINQVKIYETYTLLDKAPFNKDFPIESKFHTMKENIIINLSLTLLQKQDVIMNCKKS